MQEQHIQELTTSLTDNLFGVMKKSKREQAHQSIAAAFEKAKADGKLLGLTGEEVEMLQEFRLFKTSAKQGDVFRWQTGPSASVNENQTSSRDTC